MFRLRRKYAAEQGISDTKALAKGLKENSTEFIENWCGCLRDLVSARCVIDANVNMNELIPPRARPV
jgi:hypothetical protein